MAVVLTRAAGVSRRCCNTVAMQWLQLMCPRVTRRLPGHPLGQLAWLCRGCYRCHLLRTAVCNMCIHAYMYVRYWHIRCQ